MLCSGGVFYGVLFIFKGKLCYSCILNAIVVTKTREIALSKMYDEYLCLNNVKLLLICEIF